MKKAKILLSIFVLFIVVAINVSAQKEGDKVEKQKDRRCTAVANQIYFVDSGQTVTEVHPGSNGGNGYQLNILGTNVDQFEVIRLRYMSAVNVIPNYTNAASAKWGMTFFGNMGRTIATVRMKNKCTGETEDYKLITSVKLLNH
ncbi:MAG TPA: hypothetical protein PKY82_23730 [Pyrinomonadaceae bacterium]|nr:hypothetical protein [Pyrinomonadaceae bacterium]